MARPVFGRVSAARRPAPLPRVAHLDRDRAARRGGPARSGPPSTPSIAGTSPRCIQLRVLRARRPSRRRGRHRADVPRRPRRTSAGSRSGPGRPTARVPRRSGSGSSRSPATSIANQRRAPATAPEAPLEAAAIVADPLDVEGDAADARRGRARRGAPSGGCRPTGAGRSSCASSTRCRRPRSPASSAGPRARCGSSSTGRCGASPATSAATRRGEPVAVSLIDGTRRADALLTDRYLDALLAGAAIGAAGATRRPATPASIRRSARVARPPRRDLAASTRRSGSRSGSPSAWPRRRPRCACRLAAGGGRPGRAVPRRRPASTRSRPIRPSRRRPPTTGRRPARARPAAAHRRRR